MFSTFSYSDFDLCPLRYYCLEVELCFSTGKHWKFEIFLPPLALEQSSSQITETATTFIHSKQFSLEIWIIIQRIVLKSEQMWCKHDRMSTLFHFNSSFPVSPSLGRVPQLYMDEGMLMRTSASNSSLRARTKLEALDNLVISTIHGLSSKIRTNAETLMRKLR